jgi:hypothetical protein
MLKGAVSAASEQPEKTLHSERTQRQPAEFSRGEHFDDDTLSPNSRKRKAVRAVFFSLSHLYSLKNCFFSFFSLLGCHRKLIMLRELSRPPIWHHLTTVVLSVVWI